MSIYDFTVKDAKGNDVSMKDYEGKVLLIVNTATGCGFTPQYEGLQAMYEKYNADGFEILDFPCNQFLGQAPGTNDEIVAFCKGRFGVTFRQFSKIKVNGKDAEPLYAFLKEQQHGTLGSRIKWNFTKFLVDRNGNVVARFAPTDTPESIEKSVKELL
ncbi:MAG: glutathione peroxidase [Clostridia bacterium]|nr:glutathione peroxidase [Clostridia bacterium]